MIFGVVGAGQMGAGIAQVAAQAGFEVFVQDMGTEFLAWGENTIEKSLARLHEKGKLDGTPAEVLGRIRFTTELQDLAHCDLVVEAIVENEAIKAELFRTLGAIVKPSGILASNTSSIPITALASASGRSDRFIGMHFMNPVPLMQLVEVIRGHQTSDETACIVTETAVRLGKTPLTCNDFPGNEAIQCLMEGVADREAIDGIMKLGMNHPMGPLTLADFIGLDTCLSIMEVLHRGLGDDKYRPSPLLRKMVQAGLLGRKSGEGFYRY